MDRLVFLFICDIKTSFQSNISASFASFVVILYEHHEGR